MSFELDKKAADPSYGGGAATGRLGKQLGGAMSILLYMGCSVSMILANKAVSVSVPEEYRHTIPKFSVVLMQVGPRHYVACDLIGQVGTYRCGVSTVCEDVSYC
jgi:hypothetical protein